MEFLPLIQAVKDAAAAAEKPPAPVEGEDAPKSKNQLPKSVLPLLKQAGQEGRQVCLLKQVRPALASERLLLHNRCTIFVWTQ